MAEPPREGCARSSTPLAAAEDESGWLAVTRTDCTLDVEKEETTLEG